MKPLKEQERRVLTYILQNTREQGYAPSVRDICAALGYRSTSTVQMYLDRLLENGYLRRESGKSRSLRVVDPYGEKSMVEIPLISSAKEIAGAESPFPYLSVRASLLEGEQLFAFRASQGQIAILLCGGPRADTLPPVTERADGGLCLTTDPSEGTGKRVGGLYGVLFLAEEGNLPLIRAEEKLS